MRLLTLMNGLTFNQGGSWKIFCKTLASVTFLPPLADDFLGSSSRCRSKVSMRVLLHVHTGGQTLVSTAERSRDVISPFSLLPLFLPHICSTPSFVHAAMYLVRVRTLSQNRFVCRKLEAADNHQHLKPTSRCGSHHNGLCGTVCVFYSQPFFAAVIEI